MGKTTNPATNGKSKILTKHRKTTLETSFLERGRGLRESAILDETRDVATWSPMKTMKNNTAAKKVDTLATIMNSCEVFANRVCPRSGRNMTNPKAQIKIVVRILLIHTLYVAFLTSR